ncbi:hypothetical protein [Limosilactobacillus ingluviei]|uniref:hypothetical protein n=1 Tax=Limosilactobacillus ingluviei TaxID=148604 RepID=UPI0024BBCC27|nr:hypothetical protein [Limosilactobacillus ingluviei]
MKNKVLVNGKLLPRPALVKVRWFLSKNNSQRKLSADPYNTQNVETALSLMQLNKWLGGDSNGAK